MRMDKQLSLSAIAESAGDRQEHLRFYGSVWDALASAVFLVAGGIIAFSPLLIQTVFILMRWPGWGAAQIVVLLILFLLGFPAVRATAQVVLHRK